MLLCVILGKLSQLANQITTKYIDHQHDLVDCFNDSKYDIKSCFLVNEDIMQVSYKPNDKNLKVNRNSQLILGSTLTAYARFDKRLFLTFLLF